MAAESKLLGKTIKVAANTQALLHVLEVGAMEDAIEGLVKPTGEFFTATEVAESGSEVEAEVKALVRALKRRDGMKHLVISERVLLSARSFVLFHAE